MFRRLVSENLTSCALAALALLLPQSAALAQDPASSCATGSCGTSCCQIFHCPPALKWCMEGMPRICFQHGCPKPICNPCEAPNWGYYQKCWAPWPWPPDWSHCPVPTPASQVFPGMIPAGQPSQIDATGTMPRPLNVRPPL
ncbi:MAG TPA: hypothetical protein VNX28_18345 [Gemmataceae bacterium]|jgi:hypothetical protein|nr:hypothetical protein [Gemmataceae bacterium]